LPIEAQHDAITISACSRNRDTALRRCKARCVVKWDPHCVSSPGAESSGEGRGGEGRGGGGAVGLNWSLGNQGGWAASGRPVTCNLHFHFTLDRWFASCILHQSGRLAARRARSTRLHCASVSSLETYRILFLGGCPFGLLCRRDASTARRSRYQKVQRDRLTKVLGVVSIIQYRTRSEYAWPLGISQLSRKTILIL
jgi:hypothetical protein